MTTRIRHIALLVFVILSLGSIRPVQAQDQPNYPMYLPVIQSAPPYALNIDSMPACGTLEPYITGHTDADPDKFALAVYIHVPNAGWWTKPTFAYPITKIASDGTFKAGVMTGGNDYSADIYAVFVIPNDYFPPAVGGSGLPVSSAKMIGPYLKNRVCLP